MDTLETFYGPNAGYVLELYERYKQDPTSVDDATRAVFATWTPEQEAVASPQGDDQPVALSEQEITNIVAASALAHAIRERGHLGAHLDPLGREPLGDPALLPASYGLSDEEMAALPPEVIGGHAAEGAANALEAIAALHAMYSGTISYEFDQVKSSTERRWLRDAVGLNLYHTNPAPAAARKLLKRLTQVEGLERYLHKTFPGQKRFSIEGTDALVPMLDEIITGAVDSETREVVIGMAHRGRLNVLAHVLDKPYTAILGEFTHPRDEGAPTLSESSGYGWTGDVKYHLGAEHILGEGASVDLKVYLSPNPSHLEFVNPVIEGMARASQEIRTVVGAPLQDVDHTLPIVIHGDAAFPGEGVASETLNLWHLRGYWVGGTIHIIVNNQLGFTTESEDSRSTTFASDLAKGFSIPIIHVNADDPQACLTAVRLAHAYRDQFHKDVLIDLVGYRRWGHNEGDEPAFTQPQMYDLIRQHPTVRELFAQRLEENGMLAPGDADALLNETFAELDRAKREADEHPQHLEPETPGESDDHRTDEDVPALTEQQLVTYNDELLNWPKNFEINPKLARTLQRRANMLSPEGRIDWGQAEALAFASILADGTPIRLTGQDSERGTFSHRHAVLHSQHADDTYVPLQHLSEAQAAFSVYNSPLSEIGALGFEYGYSVHAPDSLVLWEAQYGDFANSAQVIIDQFISSGRAKWRQQSSLVMLLPHGYEGPDPEHSSSRLERYLQLSAGDNWRIANCSTAAQYFHLLRLQAFYLKHYPRPLILLTPKSLLRHPLATSSLRDLLHDSFKPVIDDQKTREHPERVKRIILCSGKVAIDLLSHESRPQNDETAIVRVELLYPLPEEQIRKVIAGYPQAREVMWVQEEPRNMGAWSYIQPKLVNIVDSDLTIDVISRPERSSPASGFFELYSAEQQRIIAEAVGSPIKQTGGKHVQRNTRPHSR